MGMALIIYVVMTIGATVAVISSLIGLIATFRDGKKNDTSLHWLIVILLGGVFIVSSYYFCILWSQAPDFIEMFRRGHA
ncbi:hypothetical protein [Xenorhabdus anantnagensis]|uniref:Uncharacterized protein n=1 Tax=Xenorhabdus anantnagensis TaxID=3025875 RepID=A0ABT5LWR9_9GAMM|nr:hypothetical protein [Xenorhabdus anantnagensis]MDC9598891.1 hypothetical protein [Xenorhabdus anantnagensis]